MWCLETHGNIAEWDGDNLTVWASTQAVFGTRQNLAQHFELPENQVRVITEHMGGGFGSKFGPRRGRCRCRETRPKSGGTC